MKTFSGRKSSQNEFELKSFIQYLKDNNVRRYMEVGARHGDTFHEVMLNLPKGSYGLAMDLPGGLWGTTKSKEPLARAVDDLNKKGYECQYIYANSQSSETAYIVSKMDMFDAILIDGDHTLRGVTQDWKNYKDRAPIIAFHDIANDMKRNSKGELIEVSMFWSELKHKYKHWEFIFEGSNMGIGVIECSPAT